MTTKILTLTDAPGNLVRFLRIPGQRYDSIEVLPLTGCGQPCVAEARPDRS